MTNDEMRELSGRIKDKRALVAFVYLLARDHLTTGTIEVMLEELNSKNDETIFTNGWLAQYAQCVSDRLGVHREVHSESTT